MADPQEGMKNDDSLLYLVGPKPFLDVKKNKKYLQLYAGFTEANWRNEAIAEGVTAGAELSVEQTMEKVAAQQHLSWHGLLVKSFIYKVVWQKTSCGNVSS